MELSFNQHSLKILEKRYLLKDNEGKIVETPTDLFERVLNYVCESDEHLKSEVRELFYNKLFLPNTPTLMNAGTTNLLSACFRIPIDDNLESIVHDAGWYQAYIHKLGGGVGINFSSLRPSGDYIKTTGGITSGVLGFMRVFDVLSSVIHQGGKRDGANMGLLRYDHPEIENFITIKTKSKDYENFNLSVLINKEFIQALQTDSDIELRFNGKIYKTIKAKQLWDLICQSSWKCGCPGVLFEDNMNIGNPFENHGMHIDGCNPCWSGDTKIWTSNRVYAIKELVGKEINVLSQDSNNKLIFKKMKNIRITQQNVDIIEIDVRNLYGNIATLRCTPNHNFYLRNGNKVEASKLKIGNNLQSVYKHKANSKGYIEITNGTDKVFEHYLISELKYGRKPDYPREHCHHIDGNKQNNLPDNLEIIDSYTHNSSRMFGNNNPVIRFPEKNIFKNGFKGKENGRYRHDIDTDELIRLRQKGYTLKSLSEKFDCSIDLLWKRLKPCNHVVVDIRQSNKKEDVYNGEVEDTHRYFVMCNDNDAILSANCGEQMLYCGQYNGELIAESCNLGSINLSQMITNGKVDWNKIKSTVYTAVEFLDRVIDRNEYPFEFIDKGTKLTRKIGLGVTGFHEMLVKLDISYGSPESIKLASNIMKEVSNYSHEASKILATRFGTYPLAHIINDNKRNATTTTIAPTGSIGRIMMGHGYSLGIEPPYAISMQSKIIESSMDEGIYPLLLQKLYEKSKINLEFEEKLPVIIEKIKSNGASIQDIKEIPEQIRNLFKTAHEIPLEQHIAVQAAFQKYTDNAVSKTINLPSDASVEDISKAFLLAYKSGCKGVTIFRNNSKDSQVMNVSNNDKRPIDELSPRPYILPSLSFTKKTACNTLFINSTFMDNNKGAVETFIDSAGEGGCSAMKAGLGIAISVYQRIIKELSPEYANDALDIVMTHLLQVKCPACTQAMIKQKYEKTKRNVDSLSCPNAVAQVMKYMLQHQISVSIDNKPYSYTDFVGHMALSNQKKCKQCGTVLIRTEGCSSLQCPSCGIGGCS